MKENEGILKVKREVNGGCSNYQEGNRCNILGCLECDNNVVRIIFPDGRQIGDNDYYKVHSEEEKYLIVFFDKIPKRQDMEEYLLNIESDYQLVRLSDGIIMRDRPVVEDEKNTNKKEKVFNNSKKRVRKINKKK